MNICRNAVATSVRLARTTVTRALARDTSGVGYIGWIGHGNLGDEAMLAAARTLLSPRNVTLFDGARREKLLAAVGLSGSAARIFATSSFGSGGSGVVQ